MVETEGAEFQSKATFAFYMLLFIGGVALYWIWGMLYGIWYPFSSGNIAIYVLYAPMIAFGVIGMLLYRKKKTPAR